MRKKNFRENLHRLCRTLYIDDLSSRGEIFDQIAGAGRIATLCLKELGYKDQNLVKILGLEEEVSNGLPVDSLELFANALAANICEALFKEKDIISEQKTEALEKILEEFNRDKLEVMH